jgi:hypothetical protein
LIPSAVALTEIYLKNCNNGKFKFLVFTIKLKKKWYQNLDCKGGADLEAKQLKRRIAMVLL